MIEVVVGTVNILSPVIMISSNKYDKKVSNMIVHHSNSFLNDVQVISTLGFNKIRGQVSNESDLCWQ